MSLLDCRLCSDGPYRDENNQYPYCDNKWCMCNKLGKDMLPSEWNKLQTQIIDSKIRFLNNFIKGSQLDLDKKD
jgi:hypothetical protein